MSNNHSLERRILPWYMALVSNILIVLGLIFIANWIGSSFLYLSLGRLPSPADLAGAGPDTQAVRNAVLTGQIGGTLIGLILLPMAYIFYLKKELITPIFKPEFNHTGTFFLVAVSITVLILPLVGVIADWNKEIKLPENWSALEAGMRTLEEKAAEMTKLIVQYNTTGGMLLVLFTVALLPAVAEELVFRGILQNDLLRSTGNVHAAVLVSAAVFSFIHFQFFGFFPRMLLGIVLGYLYITSGNILVPMLMHFVNNAMVVIALNLHARGVLKVDPESSKDLPTASIYISLVLSSAVLYYCWSVYKQRLNTQQSNV